MLLKAQLRAAALLALGSIQVACGMSARKEQVTTPPAPSASARVPESAGPSAQPSPAAADAERRESAAAAELSSQPGSGQGHGRSPELGNDPTSGLRGALMSSLDASESDGPSRRGFRARSGRSDSSGYGAGANAWLAAPASPLAPLLQTADPNTERYSHKGDNPFENARDAPLSTFSIDVDTASYANVRRFLHEGARPPIDAVRIEELINYFQYDYAAPQGDAPISVSTEVAPAPWKPAHRLVRIGLKTRAIATEAAPPNNLVFLVDVSGSMASGDKLPLLKRGLGLLAKSLRKQDRVAIVVYAGSSGLALPTTSGADYPRVLEALERLEAGGSTNGGEGIQLAYSLAAKSFVAGGNNRVILATDGDFNVGTTSEGELVRLVEAKRKTGVYLTVLGFGRGNLNDSSMEALADHGNGSYAYIDSIDEAHKVLVREAGSTLVTVAKDVKLQIEWNPKLVAGYRLIGFENRMLAARDFNDDKKDAGELGAGHSMTALYEVVPTAGGAQAPFDADPLRYQAERTPTSAAESGELMTVSLRYKRPDSSKSELSRSPVRPNELPLAQASNDFRWAAAVACFGLVLRNSEHRGDATLALAGELARAALGNDPHGQRHEFVRLLELAARTGVEPSPTTAKLAR